MMSQQSHPAASASSDKTIAIDEVWSNKPWALKLHPKQHQMIYLFIQQAMGIKVASKTTSTDLYRSMAGTGIIMTVEFYLSIPMLTRV